MLRPALVLTALLAVAAPNLGCGQTACFQWSEVEGTCPDHNQARTFFGTCTDIVSIDDDGKFANNLCCYSVTKDSGRTDLSSCGTGDVVGPGVGVATTTGPVAATTVTSGPVPNFCDNTGVCGNAVNGCMGCALVGPCSLELDNCNQSADCNAYSSCAAACQGSSACIMQCASQHPSGAMLYDAMVDCAICKSCPNDCAAMAQSCSGSSTASSSGSMGGGGMGGMSSSSGMGGAGGK